MKTNLVNSLSDESEAFIAEIPELRGCTADKPIYQQAVASDLIPPKENVALL